MQEKKERKWLLLFLVVGLGISIWALILLYEGFTSYFWKSCEGKILVSKVFESHHTIGERPSYGTHIIYEYFVQDLRYTSERRLFGPLQNGSRSSQQAIVDKYPVGLR